MIYLATVHVYRRKRSNSLCHLCFTSFEALVYIYMPSSPQSVEQKRKRVRIRAQRDLEENGFGSHIMDTQRRRTV